MKFYPDNYSETNKLKWYSLKKIFSFVTMFMYLIGGRGYGKTYSVKMYVIKDFIKNKRRFAWFRTTDIALDRIRDPVQFFGRLKGLKKIGVKSYDIRKDIVYINGEVAGYLFPISTFHNIKGADYECHNGVWDEFMRAKGERAITNKREKFFDAIESVFRDSRAKIFLISNSTNQFDEMLEPFKLTLLEYGCYLYREDKTVIHYVQPSKTHTLLVSNSASYSGMSAQQKKMSFENKFTSYGDFGKETKGKYLYSLQVDDNKFISLYMSNGKLYLKTTEPLGKLFTTQLEFINSKVKRLNRESERLLKKYYDNGQIIFVDGYCRTMFQDSIVKS